MTFVFADFAHGLPDVPGVSDRPKPGFIVPYIYASPLAGRTTILKSITFRQRAGAIMMEENAVSKAVP